MDTREKLESPMNYKWRVQSFSTFKPEATCIPYVDSRLVRDRLTDVFGLFGWKDEYHSENGSLFCTISILDVVSKSWVSKSDVGEESNISKKKGEASDAFKRAAVKWGIGRFLYDIDPMRLEASDVKKKDVTQYLNVVDGSKKVYNLTEYINNLEFNSLKSMNKCSKDSAMQIIANSILKQIDFIHDFDNTAIFKAQNLLRQITATNRNPLGFISFYRFYNTKNNSKMVNIHDASATRAEMMLSAFENSEKSEDAE